MGRDKLYPKEYNETIKLNAIGLLKYVNDLIYQLGIDPVVTSGFRPPSYNKTVKGAAKKSNHQYGLAIDLSDPKKELAKMICGEDFDDINILREFNLYAEHPNYTKNWLHIQSVPPQSGKRIFKPY